MKEVVLLGAGHVHLAMMHTIARIRNAGGRVTVIDRNRTLHYSGMAPAVLSGRVAPLGASIEVERIVTRGEGIFLANEANHVDLAAGRVVLTCGRTIPFDVLSVALGSVVRIPFPVDHVVADRVIPVKPIDRLLSLHSHLEHEIQRRPDARCEVVVVGGGSSGVEVAGTLHEWLIRRGYVQRVRITLIARGATLVPRMDTRVGTLVHRRFSQWGIEVRTNCEVVGVDEQGCHTAEGKTLPMAVVVVATGTSPPSVIADSGLPVGAKKGLLVDDTLRAAHFPIFGGGDCIDLNGYRIERIGVHAVRQNPILLENVVGEVGGNGVTARYVPPTDPLLILNIGHGRGIYVRAGRVIEGRTAAYLKRQIDWAFVRSAGKTIVPTLSRPPRGG